MVAAVPPDVQAAYRYCWQVAKTQARNFYYAFVTLPRPQRMAIYAAYAFCRLCDDIADEAGTAEEKVLRLREVRHALQKAYAGEPDGPVFTALAHMVRRYPIPQHYWEAILEGVEMDLTVHRYPTFEALKGYCYRVASAVGLVCVEIFGYRHPSARSYAEHLGLAMQLTNILRDVEEDARRGRIYLPQEDMARFGYSESDLVRGVYNPAFRALMAFEAQRARGFFRSARPLLPLLAWRSRACPAVLGGIYRRVLDKIEAENYQVFGRRIALSGREKAFLMVRLWVQSSLPTPVPAW
ncbi:MAG: presqualene diphosphate synthase HpnD [Dehalococcoidia bacterium]|nr:presqualene diphosphate synthase HpnD [Dehalococcoidia bacterium]MDW8120470.1 presqualene diphosphate synthase HpnD [Chloroflexota bacterium]